MDASSNSGTVRSSSSVIGASPLTIGAQLPPAPPPPTALIALNGAKKSAAQLFLKTATPPKLQLAPLKTSLNGNGSPLSRRSKTDDADGGSTAASSDTNGELVSINIVPDEQGRFGFNVKGGMDQKLPIIVSRVGANTPADR